MAGSVAQNTFEYASQEIKVLDARMHYIEAGAGRPILFIHSAPFSGKAWARVMPYLSNLGRCIAPDLIGFGLSESSTKSYTLEDQLKHLEAFIAELKLQQFVIVMHGFGTVLGCHYWQHHKHQVAGLVLYEPFLLLDDEDEIALPLAELHAALASCDDKDMVPTMVKAMSLHPWQAVLASMQPEVPVNAIRAYIDTWLDSDKHAALIKIIKMYSLKLKSSDVPKLLLYSTPGFVTTMMSVMHAKQFLPNLECVDVGEEYHLAFEADPMRFAQTISAWLQSLEK